MSLFWHLYLAHLLGDFPLQTNRIFAWKVRNLTGILVHVGIVVGLSALLMAPLLGNPVLWAILPLIGIAHAVQDHLKLRYSKRTGDDGLAPYLLDQVGHLLATIAVVLLFRPWTLQTVSLPPAWGIIAWAYDDRVMMIGCALIAVTYGVDVGRHILKGIKGPLSRDWPGMIERASLVLAGAGTLYSHWAWLFILAWAILRLSRWSQLKSQGMLAAVISFATGWLLPLLAR